MYTCDWFSSAIPGITRSLKPLSSVTRILEIGSFEGRSTVWFLQTFPDATVVSVDTFEGSPEHSAMDLTALYDRFCQNTEPYKDRLEVRKGHSHSMLYGLEPQSFDVIYVDGSHEEDDTLMDLLLSYGLLRPGGVMLVDDYRQPAFPGVKRAVDHFESVFHSRVTRIHDQYQVHLVKTPEP